ncbi:MAG: four helix bundle protein [Calditrichaceae bacterium]|nr:four helix bundle protein [Calditrichia bacterium]NUQ42546.1 four helix bundle protein [Calditrichaceae bacterium]
MNYPEWEKSIPQSITNDSLWKITVYRLALFMADIGWHDVTKLMGDPRTLSLADQLYRALGSISGNIEEGYSRGTGRDRARFYEYSLGSARESRGWYYRGRYILGEAVVNHRLQLLSEMIRLLLTMVPEQRGNLIREEIAPYITNEADHSSTRSTINNMELLLMNVPLPSP